MLVVVVVGSDAQTVTDQLRPPIEDSGDADFMRWDSPSSHTQLFISKRPKTVSVGCFISNKTSDDCDDCSRLALKAAVLKTGTTKSSSLKLK